MALQVLFVGGEDHNLRIPFMLAMRDRGYRVSAAASCKPDSFSQSKIDFHRFSFDRFIDVASDRRAIAELRRLIANMGPDIVHCFDTKLTLLTPLAVPRNSATKIVRTINGRGWLYSSRSPTALALRFAYRNMHRFVAPRIAATIFQNTDDQAFFSRCRLLRGGRSEVILGSGVDCDGFLNAAKSGPSREEMRRSLGVEDAELIVTVSRLTRQKGIPTLLAAAERVHAVRPRARFLLVGPRDSEGPFQISEAELARHSPYVMATGPRTDVPSLLNAADVFAFPSQYAEGVPRALLEAALLGLPIVATDLPGCRAELVDGWNGLLAPPDNARRLANRICELLENPERAARMAARGPAKVRAEFALNKIVSSHAALYESLAEASAAPQFATGNAIASAARSNHHLHDRTDIARALGPSSRLTADENARRKAGVV